MRQDGQKPVQIVTEPGWGRKQALLSHINGNDDVFVGV